MCKFARDDIAEDLGIAVRMCRKPRAWGDSVFVEDSNGTEGLESRIVILRK